MRVRAACFCRGLCDYQRPLESTGQDARSILGYLTSKAWSATLSSLAAFVDDAKCDAQPLAAPALAPPGWRPGGSPRPALQLSSATCFETEHGVWVRLAATFFHPTSAQPFDPGVPSPRRHIRASSDNRQADFQARAKHIFAVLADDRRATLSGTSSHKRGGGAARRCLQECGIAVPISMRGTSRSPRRSPSTALLDLMIRRRRRRRPTDDQTEIDCAAGAARVKRRLRRLRRSGRVVGSLNVSTRLARAPAVEDVSHWVGRSEKTTGVVVIEALPNQR